MHWLIMEYFTEAAKAEGMTSVVLTGKNGGNLAELADIEISVTYRRYSNRIREIYIKIIYILFFLMKQKVVK